MPDMEKVIKGLELCTNISQDGCMMLCPYKDETDETYSGFCEQVLKQDALALLKEQEPIPVEICGKIFDTKVGDCPHCGERLNSEVYPRWCGFCGQAVKWNEG